MARAVSLIDTVPLKRMCAAGGVVLPWVMRVCNSGEVNSSRYTEGAAGAPLAATAPAQTSPANSPAQCTVEGKNCMPAFWQQIVTSLRDMAAKRG